MGCFAIPASYAARAGLKAVNALTFKVDQTLGPVTCEGPSQLNRHHQGRTLVHPTAPW